MILEVDKLELYYGDAQALDGVSLHAEEGELVAIVGANGAGKSSLIRTIAGIETPRAGRIAFRGRDITGLPHLQPRHRPGRGGAAGVSLAECGGEPADGGAAAAGARLHG
jgi:branched-chain amino acid transport system ATP-binding protein